MALQYTVRAFLPLWAPSCNNDASSLHSGLESAQGATERRRTDMYIELTNELLARLTEGFQDYESFVKEVSDE